MTRQEITELLAKSLEDHRLSRGERQELADALGDLDREADRAELRLVAFELARGASKHAEPAVLLEWLEGVLKTIYPNEAAGRRETPAEAWFSPTHDTSKRVLALLDQSTRAIDICVFTITDDRIADAILTAHRRIGGVRVITDNDKANDLGSDVDRLREAGVPLRVDRTEYHMHHKFAIFDDARLLTGSYNWTRGAARDNAENFLITGDRRLLEAYAKEFESLWKRLGD